jgi:hypothetical protein
MPKAIDRRREFFGVVLAIPEFGCFREAQSRGVVPRLISLREIFSAQYREAQGKEALTLLISQCR